MIPFWKITAEEDTKYLYCIVVKIKLSQEKNLHTHRPKLISFSRHNTVYCMNIKASFLLFTKK